MIRNQLFTSMTAGQSVTFGAFGTHIRCLQGNANFELRAYNGSQLIFYASTWQAGLSVGPIGGGPYDKIEVVNGSTAQTVELIYGDGDVQDNRLVGTVNITGGLNSNVIAPGVVTLAGSATVSVTNTATLVLAAGTKRGKVILQNTSAAAIAVGFSNAVTFAAGIILEPVPAGANAGGSIELETNTAIYAIANTAGPFVLRAIANEYP